MATTTKPKAKVKSKAKPTKKSPPKKAPIIVSDDVSTDDEVQNIQKVIKRTIVNGSKVYEDDEVLEDEDVLDSGPEYVRGYKEQTSQRVIDELIKDIPQNEGYYIKLYKEIPSTGEYQFKMEIRHFHHWADVELEVAKLVREHTSKAPARWGTGRYKICFMREKGMRGQHYDPYIFYIDAQEEDYPSHENPYQERAASLDEKLAELDKLASIVKNLSPQQVDPSKIVDNQANAMMKGFEMKMGEGNSANNQFAQMAMLMMGMMKEVMGAIRPNHEPVQVKDPSTQLAETVSVMKGFGLLPQQQQNSGSDFFENIAKMKTIGLEPFKSQDPISSLGQVKSIIGLAKEFMGADSGERPGIGEKLVDAVAQHLPTILTSIKGMSDNYTRLQTGRPGPDMMPHIPQEPYQPAYREGEEVGREPSEHWPIGTIPSGRPAPSYQAPPQAEQPKEEGDAMFNQFMNMFHHNILKNDQSFFPTLLETVQRVPQGTALLNAVINDQMSMEQLVEVVHNWGGEKFKEATIQTPLRNYLTQFVQWIVYQVEQQQAASQHPMSQYPPMSTPQADMQYSPQVDPQYTPYAESLLIARCNKCRGEFEYHSREEFETEDKVCGEQLSATEICDGIIELVGEGQHIG